MWAFLFGLINPLSRIFRTIDAKVENETDRQRIKSEASIAYVNAQIAVMNGPGWWFMALFLGPLGVWWTAVIAYSLLWCRDCAFPQDWTIAALPSPLNDWAGVMLGAVFLIKGGEGFMRRVLEK